MIIECCGCNKKETFKDTKEAWMKGWDFVNDKFNKSQVVCDTCTPSEALQVVYNKARGGDLFNIVLKD
jgi:hypothetical protein